MPQKWGEMGHFGEFVCKLLANLLQIRATFAVDKTKQLTRFYMANLYYYWDRRSPRKDGTCALKIALAHNRKTVYLPLDVYLGDGEWNTDKNMVAERPDKKLLNTLIQKRMADAVVSLHRLELRDDFFNLSARQVADMIAGVEEKEEKSDTDFIIPIYEEYIGLCGKPSTASSYKTSLNSIKDFDANADSLRFGDINEAWLMRYQRWLTNERGMGANGANVYLRNLRRIFNYAISNQRTNARYPFKDKGVDMTTIEPDKKPIPYEKFLEWATMPMPDYRGFYRDLFMLSFYLCGIRPVDLLHVKKEQVEDGRLVYWPQKLNGRTKLSIKIEPEAWAIIKKYEGREYLINVMESRSDYKTFLKHWNEGVRAIGEDVFGQKKGRCGQTYTTVQHKSVVPYITVYYARTCWASYAFNVLGIPIDTISQALGHKNGLRVTNFYVKRDETLVDKANRNMIDRLTKDMAEYAKKKGWTE